MLTLQLRVLRPMVRMVNRRTRTIARCHCHPGAQQQQQHVLLPLSTIANSNHAPRLFGDGADGRTSRLEVRPNHRMPSTSMRRESSPATATPSVLMIIDVGANESQAELMLQEADFPQGYVDMAHPDDFKATDTPLPPQLIEHQGLLGHHRLLLRVSFKLNKEKFAPLTFVLDTGAPFHLYLSHKSIQVLQRGGRWKEADHLPVDYLEILGTKAVVHETPPTHAPANIMGLKMLKLLKLRLDDDFSFTKPFDYF